MLQAERISKSFPTRNGELIVLRDATLTIERGQSIALLGPSGSGKSTFLNIIGTLEKPSSGKISLDNRAPFALSEPELAHFRAKTIGFVFQDHHLLPQLTVLDNVLLPTLALDERKGNTRFTGAQGSELDSLTRAKHLLERVGLADRLDHLPSELSGGERQRVALARALINQPSILLADEPTGNLDRRTAQTVTELLLELHRRDNTMLMIVTHNEGLAAMLDRRFELVDGRLVSDVA